MRDLLYTFEDLPLVSELGAIAGLVGGTAEIAYDDRGEWFVRDIWLDGVDTKGARRAVKLDRELNNFLFLTIFGELEGDRFNSAITDRVVAAIENDGDAPARPIRSEHSTMQAAE